MEKSAHQTDIELGLCPPDIFYTEKGRFDLRKGEDLKFIGDKIIMIDSAKHSWLYLDPEQERFYQWSEFFLLVGGAIWGLHDARVYGAGSGAFFGIGCTSLLLARFG
jgi:hypothetical protein